MNAVFYGCRNFQSGYVAFRHGEFTGQQSSQSARERDDQEIVADMWCVDNDGRTYFATGEIREWIAHENHIML